VRLQLRDELGDLAAAFFEERLADTPFPWAELADRAGVLQRTLQRHFVDALGLRPSDVLARLRVERAKDLLRDRARPLANIAIACGYASQAHFSTAFKASTGLSPGRLRRCAP
jgi:AraC family transcriptional regulator